MFDTTAKAETPVDAAELNTLLTRLATTPGPDTDPDRIDLLRALEELKCAAEGLQAQVTADLAEARRIQDQAAGVPPERRGRGLGHQIGLARRESPWRGTRHLHLAQVAVRELPCAYAALRAGKITEHHLTVLARETTCLTREHREYVDQVVAGDMAALERHTPKTLAAHAAKLAAHLDPEAVIARRRIAESERHTSLRPAPDTMTWFSAVLPVRDGIAVHVSLEQAAVQAKAAGDPRTKGQLMADVLVARVTGRPAQHAGKGGLDTGLVPRPGSTTETSTTTDSETDATPSVVEPASHTESDSEATPSVVEPASAASGVETTTEGKRTADSVVEPASAASGVETTTEGKRTADSVVEPASAASGVETPTTGGSTPGGVIVNLVITDTQLFGAGSGTSDASEGAAHLDRYGPIDTDLARQLVKDSDRVWLRRLYADPDSGQLVAMDSRQRCFPDGLKTLIRLRDQVCRTPWCGAPIRHTDHITDYAHAGATAYFNGQGLCQACNLAKQDNWWARPGPHGSIEITTTTGHTYRSHPPAAAEPLRGDPDDGLDTGSLRSPGSTTEKVAGSTNDDAGSTNDDAGSTTESAWLAPAWIAQDREQLLADGWTETTPAYMPDDDRCPACC